MTKKIVCPIYLGKHTSCDCYFYHTSVKWWYLQIHFSFFQNFDFPGCYRDKRAKMAQNDEKLCVFHYVSQEPYLIWLLFLVHMCKIVISPTFSFIFSKFWFLGGFLVEGGIKGKKWFIITHFSLSHSISQEM